MSNNFKEKISLDLAKKNKKYQIVECTLQGEVKLRLYEMGLVPKTVVTVKKVAPLGDPLEIFACGYSLCIRAEQAKHFIVAELQN